MPCTRETSLGDWESRADAVDALRACGCLVCSDRLGELDVDAPDPEQTTLDGGVGA